MNKMIVPPANLIFLFDTQANASAETGGADGESNACLAAIAAGAGKEAEGGTREKPIEDIRKGLERTGEDLKKGARELEEGFKRLFGN